MDGAACACGRTRLVVSCQRRTRPAFAEATPKCFASRRSAGGACPSKAFSHIRPCASVCGTTAHKRHQEVSATSLQSCLLYFIGTKAMVAKGSRRYGRRTAHEVTQAPPEQIWPDGQQMPLQHTRPCGQQNPPQHVSDEEGQQMLSPQHRVEQQNPPQHVSSE